MWRRHSSRLKLAYDPKIGEGDTRVSTVSISVELEAIVQRVSV